MANQIISEVYLLDTPLKNDYKDTLYFGNESAQESYFKGRVKKTFQNVSYLRKEHTLKLNAQYDSISTCNYLMYKNVAYKNKWFYCFIKEMRYISEGVTEVEIETDVIQTYLFDYQIHRSFIEREHVDNDTIGLHTIPEGLETGDYILNGDIETIDDFQQWAYVVNVSESAAGEKYESTLIGGIACAGAFFVFKYTDVLDLQTFINSYNERPDSIIQVYLVPWKLFINEDGSIMYDETRMLKNGKVTTITKQIDKPTSIDGYTPRNKKLLTFPFQYLLLSNNNGSSNILHYENFTKSKATFELKGIPTTGASMKCTPTDYKSCMQEEGLIAGKFPICSWSNDLFTAWVNANSVNIGIGVATSALQIIGGIGLMTTGAGALAGGGMVAGGLTGIASSVGQIYEHSFTSPSAKGNTNGGDILTSTGYNNFLFYPMSIKKEYAEVLDQFLDKFGYKINLIKVPNKNHRSHWWYTKTIDANITGEIPGIDLQKIKDCYNSGITFWKNPSNIFRYDLENSIV